MSIMLLFAHRGWSARYPENSLAAFAAAAQRPIAGCEGDVRLTADGGVIVCHDAHLGRWGGNRTPLSRRTTAACQADGLPRLEEVLEVLARKQFLIELKPHSGRDHTAALVRRTLALVRQARAEDRVALLCFAAGPLALAQRLAPEVRRVRNVDNLPTDPRWLDAQGSCWAVDGNYRRLSARAVRLAQERGFRVFAYTVNQAAAVARCRRLGLDGIISDHADLVAP